MNAKKFSDAMSELDTKYVDEALNYKKKAGKKKKKQNWTKWGAMAACLCLVIVCAFALPRFIGNDTPDTPPAEENAYGFTMEGSDVLYFPISFSERKIFGIIDENATGLTAENTYKITADDLGNVMGIVGDSEDERMIGERPPAGKTVKLKFLGTGMISVMPVPLLEAHPRECSPQGRTRYVPSACACRWTCQVHLHRPP